MTSSQIGHSSAWTIIALALGGCLVSQTPLLNPSNGAATPLAPGEYEMCPLSDDESSDDGGEQDCQRTRVSFNEAGLYSFRPLEDNEEPAPGRMRRIARDGYAVQLREDDGSYLYYYGDNRTESFQLTMMLCASLPEKMRNRLIAKKDLTSESDDFNTCEVKTVRGLDKAAKAYHRGRIDSDDEIKLEFRPLQAQ